MALGRDRKEIWGLIIGIAAECRKEWAAGHSRWLQKSYQGEGKWSAFQCTRAAPGSSRSHPFRSSSLPAWNRGPVHILGIPAH
jgi:hypothetical protein